MWASTPTHLGKFLAALVLDSRRITRQIYDLPLLCKLPEHRKRPASCLVVEIHERVVEQQNGCSFRNSASTSASRMHSITPSTVPR